MKTRKIWKKFLTGSLAAAMLISQSSTQLLAEELSPVTEQPLIVEADDPQASTEQQIPECTADITVFFEFVDTAGNEIRNPGVTAIAKVVNTANTYDPISISASDNRSEQMYLRFSNGAAVYSVSVTNAAELNAAGYTVSYPAGQDMPVYSDSARVSTIVRLTGPAKELITENKVNENLSNTDGTLTVIPYMEDGILELEKEEYEPNEDAVLHTKTDSEHTCELFLYGYKNGQSYKAASIPVDYKWTDEEEMKPIEFIGLDTTDTYELFVKSDEGTLLGDKAEGFFEEKKVEIEVPKIVFEESEKDLEANLEIRFVEEIPDGYTGTENADKAAEETVPETQTPETEVKETEMTEPEFPSEESVPEEQIWEDEIQFETEETFFEEMQFAATEDEGESESESEPAKADLKPVVQGRVLGKGVELLYDKEITLALNEKNEDGSYTQIKETTGKLSEGLSFDDYELEKGKSYTVTLLDDGSKAESEKTDETEETEEKKTQFSVEPSVLEVTEETKEAVFHVTLDFDDEIPEGIMAKGSLTVKNEVFKNGELKKDLVKDFYFVIKDSNGTLLFGPQKLEQNGAEIKVEGDFLNYDPTKTKELTVIQTDDSGNEPTAGTGFKTDYIVSYSEQKLTFTEGEGNKAVTITDTYKPYLRVRKEDEKGVRLANAKLSLGGAKKTTTASEDWIIRASGVGSATLKEEEAPEGYQLAKDIKITINRDGTISENGVVKQKGSDGYYQVTMVDQKDTTVTKVILSFTKTDEKGNLLAGASLQLLNSEKNKILYSWTSAAAAKSLNLSTPGTYYMHEASAPEGYKLADDIKFTLTEDMKVLVNDKEITANEKGYFVITMKDELKESDEPTDEPEFEDAIIAFRKVDQNGNRVAGAELAMQNETQTTDYKTWTTTGSSDMKLRLKKPGKFVLTEKKVPSGYETADDILFEVSETGDVLVNGKSVEKETSSGNTYFVIKMVDKKIDESESPISPGDQDETESPTPGDDTPSQKINPIYLCFQYKYSNGTRIPNVELSIYNSSGNKLTSFKTSSGDKYLKLSASGTYTLSDPYGNKVNFSVSSTGSVTVAGSSAQMLTYSGYNCYLVPLTLSGTGTTGTGTIGTGTIGTGTYSNGTYGSTGLGGTLESGNTTNGLNSWGSTQKMMLTNGPTLIFRKVDSSGNYVVGANLSITDSTGKSLTSWTTESKNKEMKVNQSGDFTLSETSAPAGYQIASPVRFTITTSGGVEINGTASTDFVITMVDYKEGETVPAETTTTTSSAGTETTVINPSNKTAGTIPNSATVAKTGDDSPIGLWIGLMIAALAAIAAVVVFRKRK